MDSKVAVTLCYFLEVGNAIFQAMGVRGQCFKAGNVLKKDLEHGISDVLKDGDLYGTEGRVPFKNPCSLGEKEPHQRERSLKLLPLTDFPVVGFFEFQPLVRRKFIDKKLVQRVEGTAYFSLVDKFFLLGQAQEKTVFDPITMIHKR